MNPFLGYLKKALYIYMIGGILCGISLGSFIILNNYTEAARKVLYRVRSNLSTAEAIREEDEDLKKKIAQLEALLPEDYREKAKEIFILEELDRIKDLFPNYRLTVTEFSSTGNVLSIGFTALGSIENYTEFVRKVASLEGSALPSLFIDKLLINIEQTGNSVQLTGHIAALQTPNDGARKGGGLTEHPTISGKRGDHDRK